MAQNDDYVLARDMMSSIRLDAQHLLSRLQTGHVLHPAIPLKPDMKIAEIGTGTGIWILDAAQTAPKSAEFHGFDISDAQFPPQAELPSNIKFGVLDSLADAPPEYAGQFDVVHLRFWCCIIKNCHVEPLMKHVLSLLKPGGYLQWEDGDLGHHIIAGEAAKNLAAETRKMFQRVGLDHDWVPKIPQELEALGCEVIDSYHGPHKPELRYLCMKTYLMGHMEFGQVLEVLPNDGSFLTSSAYREKVSETYQAGLKGGRYSYYTRTVLARKGK